ncbi:MAG: AMP-binding protein [Bacillota bacterium]|nr:AMP-binding protein [Bacillota bacterium]
MGGSSWSSYAEEYRRFQWAVPEKFNFALDVLDAWAEKRPKDAALFLVDDEGREERLTFAALKERSRQAGAALHGLGIAPGEPVFIMLPRVAAWWEVLLGCLKAGAVAMPGTTQLKPRDIVYRLKASQARIAVTDRENAGKFLEAKAEYPELRFLVVVGEKMEGALDYEELLAEAEAGWQPKRGESGDPAMLYFTSGTTGYPKMVLHTHASYGYGHLVTGKYWLNLGPDDLHWNMSDTGWAKAAWSSFFGPWHMGATVFVHKATGKFNPTRTLEILARYPITSICASPTIYRLFVQEDLSRYRFPHLRSCVAAGEPLNPEVIRIWQEATGLEIRDGYGQTETVLLVGNFPGEPVKAGSMGKPAPGFEVEIVDDQGRPVPVGEEGNIAVRVRPQRPVGLFQEYWRDPDATASRLVGDWYITGDRAWKDQDGYLWFVGRADDVIISAGYRIGPFEVESALIEHPAVVEAAVVASPDEVRGEIVKAFVVLAAGYEPSAALVKELQDHVKNVTAPYKYPREIEFVQELPKTISGKIRRGELKELERRRKLSKQQGTAAS